MIALKRCPFCGGEAKATLGIGNYAIVFCGTGCSAEAKCEINTGKYAEIPYDALDDAFTQAALKWNTRAEAE